MSEIKSLADQLRSDLAKKGTGAKPVKKILVQMDTPAVIEDLRALDISKNKTLVHARFDAPTAKLLHHLKMATGVEVTRLLCFAVRQLLEQHPEIKTVVKQHLEQIDL